MLPFWAAIGLAATLSVSTSLRLHRIAHDRRRPRWVTRLIDEPLFAHWGAGVLSLPIAIPALGLAVAVGWPPSHAGVASYAIGLAIAAWSIWGLRRWVRVREHELPIAGLAAEFDGYRVVQLSDLHVGSFDRRERALKWAVRANALLPDLAVVTGDLVTSGTVFYEDVADVIGALRAKDGVLVALGNHDQWDPESLVVAIEARGPRVLRNQWTAIQRGAERVVVAALDDYSTGRDDLERTLDGRPEAPTLLLAHFPHFFERAAEHGVELVLSGHTHGGQIGLPWVGERVNIATALGQRGRGIYRSGRSTLYVNAGLGTTGPPMRLGIAPEIALFVLRAGQAAGRAGGPSQGMTGAVASVEVGR